MIMNVTFKYKLIIIVGVVLLTGLPGAIPAGAIPRPPTMPPNHAQTHEMTIPNDLIGCIIGRGGSKINEIR